MRKAGKDQPRVMRKRSEESSVSIHPARFIAALQEAHAEHANPLPINDPRRMALAYQVRAHCDAIGWNCTIGECAEALGVSTHRVRWAAVKNGWSSRFCVTERSEAFGKGRDRQNILMPLTELHELAEAPRYTVSDE